MKLSSQFISEVPKSEIANVAFRLATIKAAAVSRETQEVEWIKCSRDPLYWLNVYCMTDAPSINKQCRVIPFISFPFQDRLFLDAIECFYNDDSRIWEKSREQGATWIIIYALTWCFIFMPGFSALCISRKEEEVDDIGNPSRLMPKIDFILDYLPVWMKPRVSQKHLTRRNLANGAIIDGESTNKGAGASRRYTVVVVDEAAKIDDLFSVKQAITAVATSKFYISAHDSIVSYFVEMCRSSEIRKFRIHWTENPWCMIGAYKRTREGKIEVIDTTYRFPEGYNFYLPLGKSEIRSVWYDRMCRDLGDEKSIAQEVDIDLEGLDAHFFALPEIDRLTLECATEPVCCGDVDLKTVKFTRHAHGGLHLWVQPDANGLLPFNREYILGVDTALGSTRTGANSVISIGDCFRREKIGEFATSSMAPHELAEVAYAICRWLGEPLVIPETGGVGTAFMRALQKLGYTRIWWRRDEKKFVPTPVQNEPGWSPTGDAKYTLLSEYRRAIFRGDYVTHSREELVECRHYIDTGPKKVEFAPQARSKDPTGAGANHGDRVISSALVWRAMMDTAQEQIEENAEVIPEDTPMYHWLQWRANQDRIESGEEDYIIP